MGAKKPAAKFAGESSSDATLSDAATQSVGTPSNSDVTQGVAPSSNLDVMLEIGTVLGGRYEIVEMLGIGGMGAVYKARDRVLDRIIALKVMRPNLARNPEILQRFKQELLTARQVTHKNVIRIFDLAEADGIQFITMEYVAGSDLRRLIHDHGKLPSEEAIDIIHQVATGVAAAHAEGVIHRDLKPGNILRDAQGRVIVMDFGLARNIVGDGMTKTGAMLGTVEYMSPEQAKAEKLDARSDLFTIGIIFYELLTGNTPYKADSVIASLLKRTQEPAVPAYQTDPSVPRALSDILGKTLERDPAQRYQSVQEFIDQLDAYQGKRPTSGVPVAPAFTRKRWMLIGIAAVLVLVLAIATGLWVTRSRTATTTTTAAPHAPVSVLVGDFTNHTGDPIFDGTLEPMFNVALEGASFINAYSRESARKLAQKLAHPSDKLDEQTARLVAVGQGISAVITGELARRGDNYSISVTALDSGTGNVLAKTEVSAGNKDALLLAISKLAAPIRKSLGDTTPESVQVETARGALTAASLEAVHEYSAGIVQLNAGNYPDALQLFSKAIELDRNFARAYGSRAAANVDLGKMQDAERDVKLAMEHVDRMTDRERYRVRGFYYLTTHNWQKCVEEYSELVKQFPADNIGQANLAGCYVYLRNLPKAVEAARLAVEILPKSVLQRAALSFYSSYAGDFAGGEREAQAALALNPSFPSYLALVEAQLGLGQMSQAAETYQRLEKVNAPAASLAVTGLADIDLYEGRFIEAIRKLEQGAAADVGAKNPDNAAEKLAALAHIQLLRGQKAAAVIAATKASAMSQLIRVRVKAAQTLVEAGEISTAQKLASALDSESEPEPQAYGAIIEGDLLLKRGDALGAVRRLTEANNLLDTWLGHYELGRAYLEVPRFVEADAEFEKCIKRRGEALELFMDNVPTFGYFPPVYYLQGRAREGLKSPGFAEPYRTYLNIRGAAGEDPLLPEIRRRLGQ
jgi:tetratricopeptide (TPR) repeat protein